MRRRLAAALAVALLTPALSACGGAPPPPPAHEKARTVVWQDVFDGTPELYAVIRPRAIKRDPVYGPLLSSALRLAQAHGSFGGVTAMEAAEGSDEVIVAIRAADGRTDDAAIVFRGVPASIDPAKMADPSGQPLFRLVDERATVPEYARVDRAAGAGSLFVLPDRTWLVATGAARARARQAFAHPMGRPEPKIDRAALATLRLDANAFIVPRLSRSPAFGPLTRKLDAVSIAVAPGKAGLALELHYADEDAAAWAEMHARRLVEDLVRQDAVAPAAPHGRKRMSFGWLKDARIGHEGSTVVVRVAVPERLLEELPRATGADLL